jgi:hypothetical protein
MAKKTLKRTRKKIRKTRIYNNLINGGGNGIYITPLNKPINPKIANIVEKLAIAKAKLYQSMYVNKKKKKNKIENYNTSGTSGQFHFKTIRGHVINPLYIDAVAQVKKDRAARKSSENSLTNPIHQHTNSPPLPPPRRPRLPYRPLI